MLAKALQWSWWFENVGLNLGNCQSQLTYVIWTSGETAARFGFFPSWDLRPCFFEMPKDLFQSHAQSDYSKNYGARMDTPPLNQASRTLPFWEFVSQGLGKIVSDFIIAACNSDRKPTTFQTRAAGVCANSVPSPRLRKWDANMMLSSSKVPPSKMHRRHAWPASLPACCFVPPPFFSVEVWLIWRRTDLSLWQNHPQIWQNLIILSWFCGISALFRDIFMNILNVVGKKYSSLGVRSPLYKVIQYLCNWTQDQMNPSRSSKAQQGFLDHFSQESKGWS